ncbi:hypothetical protein COU00_01510 [Candidatus Falkowbacteria bacterium CG10_big_fil_rev_8_21_14_0_10_43_11]|uniref:Glycosyltransferase 2-like domain-containing protein n=1 Tax=Candidatus Falkowbacteria bacterium CG10_big_fil_rev_8_21_14_0_10_43_11 TaxID=1974568 RepID=A0A2M6WMH4_9BACT|nr:MAG: hypothetical protein COU00_01510 [Candidatus Falkowbacteria bacterium CG10_big_fil_rev_8_21_14_0_10_43_11]
MAVNYLKVAQASDLQNRDRFLYRALEILPAILSLGTLLVLIIFSYLKPVWVAYFIIIFDVYWLLLVFFLSLHLIAAYRELKKNIRINWRERCQSLPGWQDIIHLVILPVYNENNEIIETCLNSIINDQYPLDKFIVVLTAEARAGQKQTERCEKIAEQYQTKFGRFLFTVHPDGITGELKGKGANQSWAARLAKAEIIDKENLDYDKIIISVFDIDTVVFSGYFYRLTHAFLTVPNPQRASYQPIPMYHNNLWEAPFFASLSATSNTFWQMMQQIRQEKLATYSSHSMTWKALVDIGFWSTNMVSEDSRIFWHCYCHYNGNYRVEPLYFPVSMDICMDKSNWQTIINLYKQQRRWGWGVENIPYLVFNVIKKWKEMPKKNAFGRIFVQFYGFHSWATNALIIAVIGWLPLIIGGPKFNATVLSGNLPFITRVLITLAMFGLVLSAIISTLLLPKRPSKYGFGKIIQTIIQWIFLPVIIIVFGSIPALESQTRLALGGKWRLGFWVTPKQR